MATAVAKKKEAKTEVAVMEPNILPPTRVSALTTLVQRTLQFPL